MRFCDTVSVCLSSVSGVGREKPGDLRLVSGFDGRGPVPSAQQQRESRVPSGVDAADGDLPCIRRGILSLYQD